MNRMLLALAALVAAGTALSADTMLLKDGTMIEWKSLQDAGDAFEVETVDGKKQTVKKADIEKLSIALAPDPKPEPKPDPKAPAKPAPPPPPTAAEVAFDKAKAAVTVDLMDKIERKRDGVSGNWRFSSDGNLLGTSQKGPARLMRPNPPPEEYDLTLVAERKEGEQELYVGLVGGKNAFCIVFDAAGLSGPSLIDGKGLDKNDLAVKGKFFTSGASRTIVCMVRSNACVVQVDGKDFVAWKADWTKAAPPAGVFPPEKGALFLAFQGTYQFSKITVTTPGKK
jgi:hypothetical protein